MDVVLSGNVAECLTCAESYKVKGNGCSIVGECSRMSDVCREPQGQRQWMETQRQRPIYIHNVRTSLTRMSWIINVQASLMRRQHCVVNYSGPTAQVSVDADLLCSCFLCCVLCKFTAVMLLQSVVLQSKTLTQSLLMLSWCLLCKYWTVYTAAFWV